MTKRKAPSNGYIFLETQEGGSATVVVDEEKLVELGVILLHVVAGSVYVMLDDKKMYKLEEVTKGFPSTSSVREIKPAKAPDQSAQP